MRRVLIVLAIGVCSPTTALAQGGSVARTVNWRQAKPVAGIPPVQDLDAGAHTTCAVASGDVWCWGDCTRGHCGGAGKDGDYKPRKVPGLKDAQQVSVANSFACALHRNGTVSCWGWDVTKSDQKIRPPRRVRRLPKSTQISVGPSHVCALGADQRVRCWGSNYTGQLGQGPVLSSTSRRRRMRAGPSASTRPLVVRGVSNATAVASGDGHVCAVHSAGVVSCWGAAARTDGRRPRGILRDGDVVTIPLASKATSVSAGDRRSCAVLDSGKLACWNYYTMGVARVGPRSCYGASSVKTIDDHGWYAVQAAGTLVRSNACHDKFPPGVPPFVQNSGTCARTAAGQVWCWGSNENGQLGRPPTPFYRK